MPNNPPYIPEGAVDIRTMHMMEAPDYLAYIEDTLLFVDHHDVLRLYLEPQLPLATTKGQLDMLIAHLKTLRPKLKDD